MKLKIDENLGQSITEQLLQAGFDVTTVVEQDMRGARDDDLIEACRKEQRCIVTLDMGFANPLSYEPKKYSGIAVIKLPKGQLAIDLLSTVKKLVDGLRGRSINGQLWIVHKNRIRQYKPDDKLEL